MCNYKWDIYLNEGPNGYYCPYQLAGTGKS